MKIVKLLISLVVLAIGLYMLATNWGPVSPPMLSGVAFTLLGALHTYKFFACRKHHGQKEMMGAMKEEGMKEEGGM